MFKEFQDKSQNRNNTWRHSQIRETHRSRWIPSRWILRKRNSNGSQRRFHLSHTWFSVHKTRKKFSKAQISQGFYWNPERYFPPNVYAHEATPYKAKVKKEIMKKSACNVRHTSFILWISGKSYNISLFVSSFTRTDQKS